MSRRPCVAAAVCALCAQLAALYGGERLYLFAAAALILEMILILRVFAGGAKRPLLYPVLFLTFLATYFWNLQHEEDLKLRATEQCALAQEDGLVGAVNLVEEKDDQWYVYMRNPRERAGEAWPGVVIIMEELPEDVIAGCTLWVRGTPEAFSTAANPGQFDAAGYYGAKGYAFRLTEVQICGVRRANGFYRLLNVIKTGARMILEECSCEQDLGVWRAMVLGERTALDEETKALFQEGGISHILAISGLHISFIGMLLYWILRKSGLPIGLSSALAGAVLVAYIIMTGGSVSAWRACIMTLMSFGALTFGRTVDMPSAMALAWVAVSIWMPGQITQAGCQLSFCAILGVGVLLPLLEEAVQSPKKQGEGRRKKLLRHILQTLMASGAVQLVTWPVMAWHYYELPLYGLLLNLLVLPLMSLLFGTLLGAIAVGALCRGLGWNMMPARACIRPAHWIMALYRAACRWTSRLPGHMLITGRPYTWQMVLYGGLVLIFAAALMGLGAVRERRLEQPRPQVHERTGTLKKPYGRWVIFLMIWCGLLLLMPRLLVRHQTGDLTVAVMDVGQGDCIFLQWQGHALVIDGGSSSVSGVGTYRIEPLLLYYGVSRVDGWLLTHPDQDHVNGFLELVENETDIDICQVLAPAAGSDGESWETIREDLKAADIPMNLLTAGMELASGAFYMECLYPEAEERFTDSNDLCTVLRVEYGDFSMLLTGDISSEIEALLCERYQETPEKLSCDLLKVAHHGSKYSSSENFLLMTKASYGVISCGKNNYGHPSEEVLARLREAGIVPYITLEEGALVLTISGDV